MLVLFPFLVPALFAPDLIVQFNLGWATQLMLMLASLVGLFLFTTRLKRNDKEVNTFELVFAGFLIGIVSKILSDLLFQLSTVHLGHHIPLFVLGCGYLFYLRHHKLVYVD